MEWISIKNELPKVGQEVITYRPLARETGDDIITVQKYVGGTNISKQGIVHGFDRWCHPTHWMPLPEYPED